MDTPDQRTQLELLVKNASSVKSNDVPKKLQQRLDSWKWGVTGWTSPANLIITAAWRKAFFPKEDCCKIWARDAQNQQILGGYSIRIADETVTVPVFSKYDLCTGFCSSNSGMQGSRAIEKSRGVGRINRGLQLQQRTVFDSRLFADILNDLNDLSEKDALAAIKYLISIAYERKNQRVVADTVLRTAAPSIDLLEFSTRVQDPEFTKCVTAACLYVIYTHKGFQIGGVSDHKTASDGRALKAGDLTIIRDGRPVIAVEVKDRTRKLDWQNINGARQILHQFPDLKGFYFILESRKAAHDLLIGEMAVEVTSSTGIQIPISFLSLPDLVGIAAPIEGYDYLVKKTAEYVTQAPSIKPATKTAWTQMV